ncbi:hypothetical protein L227DRAFT_611819 [Lentinus tigrinus ALCF2SS1-6]|uniref:F-box domain-containing protein n=1 Tax=Lentinus tigrinus ALCF2SS1-6 TaxID=1328759 RepID=A0A5C2S8J0_9APHY|nr:hypothetical protein L227DRAFT_611819 [Lentinus tigrinus ALCF2SS1-6]
MDDFAPSFPFPKLIKDPGMRVLRLPPPQSPTQVNPHGDSCGACVSRIPEDVMLAILAYLRAYELARCRQVCILQRLIQSDTRLQYRLELGINGVLEGALCAGMSVHDRLRALQAYTAECCAPELVPVRSPPSHGRHEPFKNRSSCVVGNVTAYMVRQPDGDGPNRLVVYAPGTVHEAPFAADFLLPHFMEVAGVDVAQNLLVVFYGGPSETVKKRATVLLRTLRDEGAVAPQHNQPIDHPDALHPNLAISFIKWPSPSFLGFQIYGRYMAWCTRFFSDPITAEPRAERLDYSLEVWDWKAGRLVWRGYFDDQCTFTFLDKAHILVSERRSLLHLGERDKLRMYRFVDSQTHADRATPKLHPAGCVLALELGDTVKSCVLDDTCALTPVPPHPKALFFPDPSLRPIVIELRTHDRGFCTLLVLAEFIRFWLPRTSGPTTNPPVEMPWKDWSRHALTIGTHADKNTPRGSGGAPHAMYPCGSRVAYVAHDPADPFDTPRLVVLDLNPLARHLHAPHAGCARVARVPMPPFRWPVCAVYALRPALEGGVEDGVNAVGMQVHGLSISCTKGQYRDQRLHYST